MTRRKRYLFVTLEGGGNVPPVLGAARQLLERGHDVRVLAEPCLREPIEAIGARFVPFVESFTRTDRQAPLFEDWKHKSPPAALASTMGSVVFGPAPQTARDVERALDAEPADALVVDWLLPAGVAVGEARKLPTAVLMHCINMLPGPGRPPGPMAPARGPLARLGHKAMWWMFERLLLEHAPAFNELRSQLGLAPLEKLSDGFARADRVLVQTCASYDFLADPEPENRVYVGPVLDDPDWVESASWENPWPADDRRPLVVVSLSSTFQNQRELLQTSIDALGKLDVRGLATLGPAMADQTFDLPDNVVAVESAPHALVFKHADAFITHCGHGSIMRALAEGVPLVALPMGRDQDGNATRIVHKRLGLKPKRTARGIAAAVQRVLTEDHFRTAAGAMAEEIATEVARGKMVAELEALVPDAQAKVA